MAFDAPAASQPLTLAEAATAALDAFMAHIHPTEHPTAWAAYLALWSAVYEPHPEPAPRPALRKPRASAAPALAKPNRRHGAPSKSFGAAVKLPLMREQNCGHVFNSAGSPACVRCASARWALATTPDGRLPSAATWPPDIRLTVAEELEARGLPNLWRQSDGSKAVRK